MDGRWAWLENPKLKILKLAISVLWGFFFVAIYVVVWCWEKIERLSNNW